MSKLRFNLSTLFITLFAVTGMAGVTEVIVDPGRIHLANGFDSNDDVEVVITGDLPDTCHGKPQGKVAVKDQKIIIDIKSPLIHDKKTICVKTLVPYIVSVPVGKLNEGNYTVAVNAGEKGEKNGELVIAKPNSKTIDDFTYANVTNVRIENDKNALRLEGAHPSSCVVVERVDLIPNEANDTIAVLPIVKQLFDICDRKMKPFVVEIPVDNLENDDLVYHVRMNNGKALNIRG